MITNSGPWRLTVAIVAALAVLMLAPASGYMPSRVLADVSSISSGGVTQVNDNANVAITVVAVDDDGLLTISTNDSDDILTSVSCSPSCVGEVSGSGTSTVTIDTDDIDSPNASSTQLTVSLSLRADCDTGPEVITVSATQDGDTNSLNINCGQVHDTDISIHKNADFTNAFFRFVYSVSNGTCSAFKGGAQVGSGSSDDFTLSDNQSVSFDCTNNAVLTVTEDIDGTLVAVSCGGETGVSVGTRSVQINTALTDANVSCTFNNNVVTHNPAAIQLSASNVTPNCGTTITISAFVFTANGGAAPNGTVVTFSAAPGTLSSTTATTVNGVATVTYTSPPTYNSIVAITATTGLVTVSAQGQLRVVCAIVAAPQPPAPTPRPVAPTQPTQPTQPPRPPLVVAPPSAGDGGLLESSGFGWTLFAGLLLAAGITIGGSLILYREPVEKD